MHSKEDREKYAEASEAKDWYFVAVKALIRDGDKLLITHDVFGSWDVPGGRIRKDQFSEPLESILDAKIREELGADIRYELGDIKTTFRIERTEVGRTDTQVRVFAVGYEATYIGGDIRLGDYHDKFEWIDLKTADLTKYPGGCRGVNVLAIFKGLYHIVFLT